MDIYPADIKKGLDKLRDKVEILHEKRKDIHEEGSSGGGLVKVKMNGQMEVFEVCIDPVAVDPRDVKMLEELIVSACAMAHVKISERVKEEMTKLTNVPFSVDFPMD